VLSGPLRTSVLLAVVVAALYLPRLGDAPVYLSPDEIVVGLHAHSLATTGRDHNGRLLPLYIEYTYPGIDASGHRWVQSGWLPPMIFYAVAAVLRVLPVTETTVRLPTAIVGILNIVLIYLVGRKLLGSETWAIASALLLALTPAHFIHSRLAMDYLYPLPFMLVWMLCLLTAPEGHRNRRLFIGTAALGIGMFSYIAATIIMPLFLLVTLGVLWREKSSASAYVAAILGFGVATSLYIPWLIAHPATASDVLVKYGVQPGTGIRSLITFHAIGDQLSRLWAFFDPRFLFFDGPMEPMYSTRTVGVFLLAMAPLLAAGLWTIARGPATRAAVLLVVGLILSPIPATVLATTDAIYRALEVLPFVVLLCGLGLQTLWSSAVPSPRRRTLLAAAVLTLVCAAGYSAASLILRGRLPASATWLGFVAGLCLVLAWLAPRFRAGQLAAIGLLATMPLQFASFCTDYFGNYRLRTLSVFSGNIRGAFEETIREVDASNAPAIYLGRIGPYGKGSTYWPFYLIRFHRPDLAARTVDAGTFERDRVLGLQPGSVIVTNAGEGETDAIIETLVAAGQLSRTPVREPDGAATFWVLRRTAGS
jgi:4-amino-4-deoxy-L-arabinose transferase-like glycosyltransferase